MMMEMSQKPPAETHLQQISGLDDFDMVERQYRVSLPKVKALRHCGRCCYSYQDHILCLSGRYPAKHEKYHLSDATRLSLNLISSSTERGVRPPWVEGQNLLLMLMKLLPISRSQC